MVPGYTVRIHWDGRIEIFGARFFRHAGPPTSDRHRLSATPTITENFESRRQSHLRREDIMD